MTTTATTYRYLAPATRIYAGVDALPHVAREMERIGAKRAFIVCSETVAETTNLVSRIRDVLGDGHVAGVFAKAKRESPAPLVEAGVDMAKAAQPDVVVAVGVGSAVVTTAPLCAPGTLAMAAGIAATDAEATHVPKSSTARTNAALMTSNRFRIAFFQGTKVRKTCSHLQLQRVWYLSPIMVTTISFRLALTNRALRLTQHNNHSNLGKDAIL